VFTRTNERPRDFVCTAFGIARTSKQDVRCEMLEGYFHALAAHELSETAVSPDGGKE
jgi:hypothetical protein